MASLLIYIIYLDVSVEMHGHTLRARRSGEILNHDGLSPFRGP